MQVDFSKIFTPELYESVRKLYFPWAEDSTLDWTAVAKQYFGGQTASKEWYDLTFHSVFKPVSKVTVENVPDLMQFLPSPEAEDFPAQAIGLLVLLDQGPRILFDGANNRYTYGYFDRLSSKLAHQLLALPPSQSPYSLERLVAQGWSFDYALVALIWLTAPLVHAESVEAHQRQTALSDDMRRAVEAHTGTTDPHRATAEEDSRDIYGFSRVLLVEVPKWENTRMEVFMYWLLRVFRVHTPIIEKFGGYPYRNPSLGRISTPEEEQYLKDTDYFAALTDEEVIKKIRRDVEEGKWSPLEDVPEFS